jgi:hypothetical protein
MRLVSAYFLIFAYGIPSVIHIFLFSFNPTFTHIHIHASCNNRTVKKNKPATIPSRPVQNPPGYTEETTEGSNDFDPRIIEDLDLIEKQLQARKEIPFVPGDNYCVHTNHGWTWVCM